MNEILLNLARIELTKFCEAHDTPPNGYLGEGTQCVKIGQGYCFSLVSELTGNRIASVTFNKSAVPTLTLHPRS